MGIRWQIKFKSFLGTAYVLNIYDSEWSPIGNITQLKGADVPFITNEDNDEDIYKPIRNQSGYIRFIAENTSIVGQMMPSNPTDRPVVLTAGETTIRWAGFLSNEQYSQPWQPCPYVVEIPVVSMTMAMRGVKFTQAEGYTSLLGLINTINGYLPFTTELVVPSDIPVGNVFVNNNNFREFLTIPERADRGTTDMYECRYIYECVEEFCKYFGISLHEYQGVFYFTTHNATLYEDVDLSGNTRENLWSTYTLAKLVLCGASNLVDFSQVFRSITGIFITGRDKAENVYSSPDSFFKNFLVEGDYFNTDLLFYGNNEILPYANGIQQTLWISGSPTYSGGQIIRHRDETLNIINAKGSSWNDYFNVYSQKADAGSPQTAIAFNIPNKIYINDNEYTALNISCSVGAWYELTQGEDFIKRLHCKVKVGNYWLMSEHPSSSPDSTQYSWTTSESSCWLLIDNGSVTMENAIVTLDFRAEAQMENITGFAIDMPSDLVPGYYNVYMELLCNAEDTADFDIYSSIGYLVRDLRVKVLRAVNNVSQPTPDFEENSIIRFNDKMGEDYGVDGIITTKRGTQYGVGMALDADHGYISTKYDELGVIRRANALGDIKEILTIDVRKNIQPTDLVAIHSSDYSLLSQAVNWRDDTNTMRIRKK